MTDMSPAEAVFFAALAKVDPAERTAYLNEACGADIELRHRVDWLLEAHPEVGSFLQEGAAVVPAPLMGETPGPRNPAGRISSWSWSTACRSPGTATTTA